MIFFCINTTKHLDIRRDMKKFSPVGCCIDKRQKFALYLILKIWSQKIQSVKISFLLSIPVHCKQSHRILIHRKTGLIFSKTTKVLTSLSANCLQTTNVPKVMISVFDRVKNR